MMPKENHEKAEKIRDKRLSSARTKGKLFDSTEEERRNYVLSIRRDGNEQCRQALKGVEDF